MKTKVTKKEPVDADKGKNSTQRPKKSSVKKAAAKSENEFNVELGLDTIDKS